MPVHQLHQVQRTLGVRAQVNVRILDAVADAGAGREIEDGVETMRRENGLELVEILDVGLDEGETLATLERGEAVAFHPHVVGVVQIVEPHHLDPLVEEEAGDARGDEAGATGDKDTFHQAGEGTRMAPLMALISALSKVSTSE